MQETAEDDQRADLEFRRLCSDLTLQTKKDGFFKDYLRTMAEQTSPEEFEAFARQPDDFQRVSYLWTLPAFHRTLPFVRTSFHAKNSEESIQRRNQGNEYFKDKNYRQALILYNQSVIHAPYSSVLDRSTLAVALANRSAALVHLREFALAIRDIQLALQSGYPESQRYKLYDRLGYCYQQTGDPTRAQTAYNVAMDCLQRSDLQPEAIENWKQTLGKSLSKLATCKADAAANRETGGNGRMPELLKGPHPEFPNASSALTLDSNDTCGRFFKAAEDIKPGQTLIHEKPFACCLLPDKLGSHCYNCFVRVIAPLGCFKCRSVAYCSAECRDTAESTYHQYECGIIDILKASGVSILSWLALRILTQGQHKDFLQWRPILEKTAADPQKGSSDGYPSVYHLVTLSDRRSSKDFFDRSFMALFLFQCLRATGYFQDPRNYINDPESITEDELYMASLLLRHLQLLQFNAHEIHEFIQASEQNMQSTKTNYIGVGIYPTVAFFNHSCRPDVTRYFLGTSLVICSSRSVRKGFPVNENYGPLFTHKDRKDRQCSLQGRYWFNCQCPPCLKNWPGYDGLPDMESALTCCPQCRGEIQSLNKSYVKCLKCKKQSPWEAVRRPVDEMTALYQTAMQVMDKGMVDKAVQLLSLFIDMMETLAGDEKPVRELTLAQEALRLCLGTYGTKYSAATHLTLKVSKAGVPA